MRFYKIIILMAVIVSGVSFSDYSDFQYEKAWQEVEQAINKGLPKTAIKKIKEIYLVAKKEGNIEQEIKATTAELKLVLNTEELGLEKVVSILEERLAASINPGKSMLHSLTAELFSQYYSNQYYKISQRTNLASFDTQDIRTWAPNNFRDFIADQYLSSIDTENREYRTEDFKDLLTDKGAKIALRPSLYDLLVDRALTYFSSRDYNRVTPSFAFSIDDMKYYSGVDEFITLNIDTRDSTSKLYRSLLLFKNQLQYQKGQENERMLASYDLMRIDFVNANNEIADNNLAYESALITASEYHRGKYAHEFLLRLGQSYINRQNYDEAEQLIARLNNEDKEDYISAQLQNLINRLNQKSLNIQVEQVVPRDEVFLTNVSVQNVDALYFKIVKAEVPFRELFIGKREEQYRKIEKLPVVRTWNRTGLWKGYRSSSHEEIIDGLEYGKYIIVVSTEENFGANAAYQTASFHVSDIAYGAYIVEGRKKLLVRNRKNGESVKNADVEVYSRMYNRSNRMYDMVIQETLKTDRQGWVSINAQENSSLFYVIKNGQDVLGLDQYDYNYREDGQNKKGKRTEIFTDRAIYRPGQTIYFKTLSMNIDKEGLPSIDKNEPVNLRLVDVNGQDVEKLNLKSSAYGSTNGSFTIPMGRLTGYYNIIADHGSTSISVEEYKRPKFETELKLPAEKVSLGQEVKVSGSASALSGGPISNAMVVYNVQRVTYYGWWGWYRRVPAKTEIITQGEITTDEEGAYVITFDAEADKNIKLGDNPTYNYQITVDVTDISGETRSATESIAISVLPYAYTLQLDEVTDISQLNAVEISAKTSNNLNVPSEATLRVVELTQPKVWQKNRLWNLPSDQVYDADGFDKKVDRIRHNSKSELSNYPDKKVIHTQKIKIGKDGVIFDFSKKCEGGKSYRIEIESQEKYSGAAIVEKSYVAVTDMKKDEYPPLKLLYVNPKTEKAVVGDKYEVKLGTPDRELIVYYHILRDQKVVHKGIADVKNDYVICYEIDEKDRGGISLVLDYVKHSRQRTAVRQIKLPWDNKRLNVELITKRDKVLPGSNETWQLKISGIDKDKTISEVLATMYDASLDQFVNHQYKFSPYINHYGNLRNRQFGFGVGSVNGLNYIWNRAKGEQVNLPVIPRLKGLDYMYSYGRGGTMKRRSMMKSSNAAEPSGVMEESAMMDMEGQPSGEGMQLDAVSYDDSTEETLRDTKPKKEVSVRKNLNETVFFYPNLKTDEDGNLLIEFTMNEALTTWKLLTFAHDQELRFGLAEHEVKTQKDLMIVPNAPRFLREGDEIIFPATVSNLTDQSHKVSASLELIDPMTGTSLNALFDVTAQDKIINVNANQSSRVDWRIVVPNDYKRLVKYRVIAYSGDHTDGEENVLPVVTNQMLVTETEVISVKKMEQKEIKFSALDNASKSSVPHRYTLEYTSNPIWYTVQALPYLMEYPHQCTEQIFNRMYANMMASYIANANPRIKAVFDEWKAYDSDALLSNLEKNTELKSVLLEETPWVRAAASETEQKKRIALLFDLNKMADETNSVLDELANRQMSSGAFPWFTGGRENVYITQNIVEGILHLQHLGILDNNDQLESILQNALKFLDEQSIRRYTKLLERIEKNGGDINKDNLDRLSIHYLYLRSFIDQQVPQESEAAYNYYMGQAKKYWLGKGLYAEAMIGLTLHRAGAPELQEVVKSIKERSFYSEELGRYWNLGSGFQWYELPIESHAMLIELFTEVESETDFVEDMKIWLLKNKQTNHWKTTKATAAAIYSLLIHGESGGMTSWINEDSNPQIEIGNQQLDINELGKEAGTGYIKKAWVGDEISDNLGSISIKNNNETIAWGAAYYQYFEDIDKVTDFRDSPLKIKKQLFVEKMTNSGSELLGISETDIEIGDRVIVRLEISADRNMSYLHIKDMRASGFEPENVLSGYRWNGGIGYYESTRDLASHFFVSQLNKGTFVFEYATRAVHKGAFSVGTASIQCMYAPEFTSHAGSGKVEIQ